MTKASEVLGVGPDVSEHDVKVAYREQVRKYHPDVFDFEDLDLPSSEELDAQELFIDVEKASSVLLGSETTASFNYNWQNGKPTINNKDKNSETDEEKTTAEDKHDHNIGNNRSSTAHSENSSGEENKGREKEDESESPWDLGATNEGNLGDTVGANFNDRSENENSTQNDSSVGRSAQSESYIRPVSLIIGFFPSLLLLIIFPVLGPILGGGIAGYLHSSNSKQGSVMGMLTNIAAVIPLTVYWFMVISRPFIDILGFFIYASVCGAVGGAIAAYTSIRSSGGIVGPVVHLLGLTTGFFGPLVVYLILNEGHGKRNAANALNWQIMVLIFFTITAFLSLLLIGFLLMPVVILLNVTFCIVASIKAFQGKTWSYPITYKFV